MVFLFLLHVVSGILDMNLINMLTMMIVTTTMFTLESRIPTIPAHRNHENSFGLDLLIIIAPLRL